jgi:hypothetical protein
MNPHRGVAWPQRLRELERALDPWQGAFWGPACEEDLAVRAD